MFMAGNQKEPTAVTTGECQAVEGMKKAGGELYGRQARMHCQNL